VFVERPERRYDVPVMPDWLTTVGAKLEFVDTWTVYDVAPVAGFHFRFRLGVRTTAALAGSTMEGTDGAGLVTKATIGRIRRLQGWIPEEASMMFTHRESL